MKYLLVLIAVLSFGVVKAQEVKITQNSSVPGIGAYIIDGKYIKDSELPKITADQVESVNVVKRDTVIDKTRFDSQIIIKLKKIYPKELPKKD
jgi:polysaccharide deacetylase 2 family uncharacterized protein YibQ